MGALGSQQLWEEELLDTAAGKEDKEQLVAREIEKYYIYDIYIIYIIYMVNRVFHHDNSAHTG